MVIGYWDYAFRTIYRKTYLEVIGVNTVFFFMLRLLNTASTPLTDNKFSQDTSRPKFFYMSLTEK